MLTKRILLALFALLMLTAPALSLAESDYETGDGWIYQDGELKITTNNGLINFLYHEFDMIGDPQHKHSAADVDRVIIGKDVTDIIIDYFIGDYNPSTTSVEAGNDTFVIDGGWVINKKTNTLFGAANVKQNKNRSEINDLPTYIEHIGMYAFSDCRALRQITIPDLVISIGDFSFSGCECLENITLPSKVITIDNFAFSECTNLKRINFEAAINSIGIAAFHVCVNLETPSIYNTKTEVMQSNSFWGCDQFRIVEFPASLKMVEDQAFAMCENLNTLIFNSDQLIIENGAFTYCKNLKKLVFKKGKPISIGTTMFNEDGKTPDGKCFITYLYDTNGETIAYPTLYYTAAYAGEWAPNGETDWNGYPIQQISQEELDAILTEARGEAVPESVALSPTPLPTSTQQPNLTDANSPVDDGWVIQTIMLAMVMVGVAAVVVLVNPKRKRK
ncbi:MAG: leucine-rich repeat domain-containing protein [Eubacteriales bacterium]|nr:leucine-rich repeat domain-containing protein [Eubacteriales bacterium]